MTERENRNEEMKQRIRQAAEVQCEFIDLVESELKQREAMSAELAAEIDRLRAGQKAA